VHVIAPSTILTKGSSIGTKVRGFVMDQEDSINIDVAFDFDVAELIMRRRQQRET